MATKQIAINQLEKLLQNDITYVKLFDGEDDSPMIEIRSCLPLNEMWDAVNEMVEMCVPLVDGEYVFMPENRDFAMRRMILSRYANFRLPMDFAKQYDLVYNTPVFQMVVGNINQDQLREILIAVDRKIDFRKDEIISSATVLKNALERFTDSANELSDLDGDAITKAITLLNDTGKAGEQAIAKVLNDAANAEPKQQPDVVDNIVYLDQDK